MDNKIVNPRASTTDLEEVIHELVPSDQPNTSTTGYLDHFHAIVMETIDGVAGVPWLSHVVDEIRLRLGYEGVRLEILESAGVPGSDFVGVAGDAELLASVNRSIFEGTVLRKQTERIWLDNGTSPAETTAAGEINGCCVPVMNKGVGLGGLMVLRRDVVLDSDEIDLLERIAAFLGAIITRYRGRASELYHLDRLISLQNLMARIISQENVTENVSDILSEIASAFDYSGIALGLIVGDEIQFFSTYRSAITGGAPIFRMPVNLGVAGRAVSTGEPQFIENVAGDPDYRALSDETAQELCVPIRVEGEVVGVLDGHLDDHRQLVVDDLGVMLLLADSFGLVISNRRRLDQLKRRNLQLQLVERVVATIAGKEIIRNSFYEILHEITDTFGFDLCSIALVEDDRLTFTSVSRHPEYTAPVMMREGIPLGTGVTGQVAATGEPQFIHNVSDHPDYVYSGWEPGSEICVPIMIDSRVAGVINVESVRERPLGDDDFEILTIIANHLGIAMAKDELLVSERESRLAVEAIQQVSSIVASTLDLDEALQLVVGTLSERFGFQFVAVGLIEGDYVRLRAAYGYDASRSVPVPLGIDVIGGVAQTGEPLFIEQVSRPLAPGSRPIDATSRIAVPIRFSGQVVGVLDVIGTQERELNQTDLQLLQTFADHTGIVLNNARMYAEVRRLAILDPITGVPNHRYFQERLAQEFEHAIQHDLSLSLMVIDLDNFKMVNDQYGHIAGDGVLSQVSQRLTSELRQGDVLARYAGDEFVVLLPGATRQQAVDIGFRLREGVRSEPFQLSDGHQAVISITVGVATYPESARTRLDLLRSADDAMYEAKRNGRDSVLHAETAID